MALFEGIIEFTCGLCIPITAIENMSKFDSPVDDFFLVADNSL